MKYNVLFVCAGNICRSPLAQGIFAHKCRQQGLDGFFGIDSAGTEVWNTGSRPDARVQKIARKHGILLQGWSRKFLIKDFDKFDLILAMDNSNLSDLKKMAHPKHLEKIKLMREYDTKENFRKNVPDPYIEGKDDVQELYNILDMCCGNLLAALRHAIS